MVDFVTPIILSLIAGAASGIGGLIGVYKRLSMKYFDLVIGFAAGVMLAVATLGLIEEGISDGRFRPVNAAVAMKTLISMMGPVVFTARPAGTPAQMLDDALDLFFNGIEP